MSDAIPYILDDEAFSSQDVCTPQTRLDVGPYTLSYLDEASLRQAGVGGKTFRDVHLDPHALKVAAVFAILTRLKNQPGTTSTCPDRVRLYAGEDVDGFPEAEVERVPGLQRLRV